MDASGEDGRGAAAGAHPGPQDLRGLLQYHEGSVVSRVLLKNKGGNVTVFAFDAGEGLSEHTAPFDALIVGVEGEADVTIEGQAFRLHAGQSVVLPANRPHAVAATAGPFKMMLVMIRG